MKSNKRRNDIIVTISVSVIALGLIIMYILALFRPFEVRGISMSPTLEDGQIIFAKIANFEPENGDVIIYSPPGQTRAVYVGRVIAKEGEEFLGKSIGKSEFYIVGDNVNLSIDSRKLGPIPESSIVGIVVMPNTLKEFETETQIKSKNEIVELVRSKIENEYYNLTKEK